jgi:hypothetical protein
MKVGMLWFDGEFSQGLDERITRAATYYRDKYGRVPNLCVIHPATAGENPPGAVNGVHVKTSSTVQPDHFWLGFGKSA